MRSVSIAPWGEASLNGPRARAFRTSKPPSHERRSCCIIAARTAPPKAWLEETPMVQATALTAAITGILAVSVTVVHAMVWGCWSLFGG